MRNRFGTILAITIIVSAVMVSTDAPSQAGRTADVSSTLTRIGKRLEDYYSRAQSLVCLETVRFQALNFNLSPEGLGRQLEYELRVEWEPSVVPGQPPRATVLRTLLKMDGRPPKAKGGQECLEPASPEPLEMLLLGRQEEYSFASAGSGRVDRRATVLLDYKPVTRGDATVQWRGDCMTVTPGGRARGRVWVDAATDDVLRFDEQLTGLLELDVPREQRRLWGTDHMTLERADSSIRYKAVTFQDPDETLMLPSSIDGTLIFRSPGIRSRTRQTFTNYRRFVTGARVVDDRDAR